MQPLLSPSGSTIQDVDPRIALWTYHLTSDFASERVSSGGASSYSNRGSRMSQDTPDRPMVLVGRDEITELFRAWAEYTSITGAGPGAVDPILSLRKTGAILRSVDRVLATVVFAEEQAESSEAPIDGPPRQRT